MDLAVEKPSKADQEYTEKTLELKDYLRKKVIHAQIFKDTEPRELFHSKTGASFKVNK